MTKTILFMIASAALMLFPAQANAQESLSADQIPPVVIKTVPEAGTTGVDFGVVEVRITYSKRMEPDRCSFFCVSGHESKSLYASRPRLEDDGRTFVFKLRLEPNTTYGFAANSAKHRNFKDTDGNPAMPYVIAFKTKAK